MQGHNPMHCKAKTRSGAICRNRPIKGAVVCRMHGGSAPQVKRKAEDRLRALIDPAIDVMQDSLSSKADGVRLKTAMYVVDRVGLPRRQMVAARPEIPRDPEHTLAEAMGFDDMKDDQKFNLDLARLVHERRKAKAYGHQDQEVRQSIPEPEPEPEPHAHQPQGNPPQPPQNNGVFGKPPDFLTNRQSF